MGTPPPATPPNGAPAAEGTTRVNFASADANVPPPPAPVVAEDPPPADNGSTTPTSKLFPNVDTTDLCIDAMQRERFHATDRRPGHDDDAPAHEGDRWTPGWQQSWQQRAIPPIRPVPTNPYLPSCPRAQDSRPQLMSNDDNASLGGSISSPRNAAAKLPLHGSAH